MFVLRPMWWPSALAAADEQGAAPVIEIRFGEGAGFLDAQAGPPQDHDQAAEPAPAHSVTGGAHHGDDLHTAPETKASD